MASQVSRSAGLGGVLAFTAWLLQPLAVFVLAGSEDGLTWRSLEATGWSAPYGMLTFCLIALGVFLLVHGIDRQVGATGDSPPLATAGRMAGYVSVVAWLLVAVSGSALFTTASSDLSTMAVSDQRSALAIYGVVQMTTLLLAVLCGAMWLAMIGTFARQRGVVGRPTAYVALVSAGLAVVPFVVPFSAPWGALGVFATMLWLGVQQLRVARSLRTAAS